MQGAGNGRRMDEDPVGLRHWVGGGPLGNKHGMRDMIGGTGPGQGCGTGRTTAPWYQKTIGRGDWAGEGMWQRGTGQSGDGIPRAPSNSPVGLRN